MEFNYWLANVCIIRMWSRMRMLVRVWNMSVTANVSSAMPNRYGKLLRARHAQPENTNHLPLLNIGKGTVGSVVYHWPLWMTRGIYWYTFVLRDQLPTTVSYILIIVADIFYHCWFSCWLSLRPKTSRCFRLSGTRNIFLGALFNTAFSSNNF